MTGYNIGMILSSVRPSAPLSVCLCRVTNFYIIIIIINEPGSGVPSSWGPTAGRYKK